NDDKEMRAFSLAKIGVMFAAFRLRDRVRLAGQGLIAKDADDLFGQLTSAWQTKVESRLPEVKKDFPQWKDIFAVTGTSGSWTINFTDGGKSWSQLDTLHGENGVAN